MSQPPGPPAPDEGREPGPEPGPAAGHEPGPPHDPYRDPYQQPYRDPHRDPHRDPYRDPQGRQGPYGYAYPPPGYGYAYPPRTNAKATAALWTGIGSLVLTPCCGAGVLGVLPVVLGAKARSEIRASGGQQEGDGMALAGIVTGAVAILLSLALIALIVLAVATGQADFGGPPETAV